MKRQTRIEEVRSIAKALLIGIGTMRQRAAYMRYGLLPFRKIEFLLTLPRTERITRRK